MQAGQSSGWVGVAVGVAVGVGVGEGAVLQKISIELRGVTPSLSVATCYPDVPDTANAIQVGVGGKVAPRNHEWLAKIPAGERVNVHFIRRVGRRSALRLKPTSKEGTLGMFEM